MTVIQSAVIGASHEIIPSIRLHLSCRPFIEEFDLNRKPCRENPIETKPPDEWDRGKGFDAIPAPSPRGGDELIYFIDWNKINS